ncbi:hypothetical protein EGH21_19490 [Halomicroarcula sp. F13]|uniref:Conjugal transfer protein TrbL n=1 Tax=Haloarcula rubra TaxID=2487747 RepID=A0AAW4PY21_9EURY|nr:hypothetical protein [Halomicroarcula rubra]MBX0325213.1 hypothetical protein [Halomicroarcula rubra]
MQSLETLRDVFYQALVDLMNLFPVAFKEWLRRHVMNTLVEPLVGTPAPRGGPTDTFQIAFRTAVNSPWSSLIETIYFDYVVGLALGLQLIVIAAVGLRYQSMNPVIRKKVGRRLFIAFLSVFVWLPMASLGLQFFDVLGTTISTFQGADEGAVAAEIFVFNSLISFAPPIALVMLAILLYIYAKVLAISITRWIGVILLTLGMPLLATFWAIEVWPFGKFSSLSKQIAATYPGLIAASLPSALLIRIGIEVNDWGVPGMGLFAAPLLLYLSAKAQKMMIQKSSPTLVRMSDQAWAAGKKPVEVGGAAATLGAYAVGGPAAGGAVTAAQSAMQGNSTGTALGARMVHRELSGSGSSGSGPSQGPNGSGSSGTGAGSAPAGTDGGGPPGPSAPPSSSAGGSASTGSPSTAAGTASATGSSSNSTAADPFEQAFGRESDDGTTADSSEVTSRQTEPADGEQVRNRPTAVVDDEESSYNRDDTTVYHHDADAPEGGGATESGSRVEQLHEALQTDADILGPDAYRFPDDSSARIQQMEDTDE